MLSCTMKCMGEKSVKCCLETINACLTFHLRIILLKIKRYMKLNFSFLQIKMNCICFVFFTFHIVFRQSLCSIIKVTLFHSTSIPLCTLINQHLSTLARKFPQTKFLKSISTTCIPNYPDRNLPTIFIYFEGQMKAQFIGPLVFGGMNLKVDGKESL